MAGQLQYLTAEGFQKLEQELQHLIQVRRAEVAGRLHLAMDEGGDPTENFELEDARKEQSFVEGEIQRIEQILNHAVVIEDNDRRDRVTLGARVTISEKGSGETEVYQIVGPAEAQPGEGRISDRSPLGQALLGKKVRQRVRVAAPGGEIVFTIKSIE